MSTISIDVDLDDVWYEVTDKQLLTELRSRNIEAPGAKEAVTAAIAQIRRGDTLDAITTLEREFWPKWASVEDSEAAFRKSTEAAGKPAAKVA